MAAFQGDHWQCQWGASMLVDNNNYQEAVLYADKAGVERAAVLGGAPLISDKLVNKIVQQYD